MRSWKATQRTPKSNTLRSRLGRRTLLRSRFGLEPLEERALLAVVHVALTGNDGTGDGSIANPYRTIQAGINATAADDGNDDIVRVAGGDYNVAGVDLGFTIPNDPTIDTLDIAGGFDATFSSQDFINTPTVYEPPDAGEQIVVNDADVTIDGIQFFFDGTNTGIVLNAGNFTLSNSSVIGAFDGIVGDGLTGSVTIETSLVNDNEHNGLQLTNQTGQVQLQSSQLNENGNLGFDFEGSEFVSIQVTQIFGNEGGGARVVNPGGQVSVGNNSNISANLAAGLVVNGASQLSIDATLLSFNGISGLIGLNITGAVSITGASNFSVNSFFGASLSNIGSLNVDNVIFSENSAAGLAVSNVAGAVTIDDVTAELNSTGIGIEGAGSVSITATEVSESTVANGLFVKQVTGKVHVDGGLYSGNVGWGIEVRNANEVEIENLAANQNEAGGVLVEDITTSVTVGSVTALSNLGGGFEIRNAASLLITAVANGNDALPGLWAENITGAVNILGGAYVNGLNGSQGVVVNTIGSLNVNTVFIQDNSGTGLSGTNVTGNVILNDVQLTGNFVGIDLTSVGDVTLTDVVASNNNSVGMQVNSAGFVDDLGGRYSDNAGAGAILVNIGAGGVIFVDALAEANGGEGILAVDIIGSVTLDNVNAGQNGNDGVHIESAGAVILNDVESNSSVNGDGLHVEQVASIDADQVIAGANSMGAGMRVLNVTGATTFDACNFSQNNVGLIVNGAASVTVNILGAQVNTLSGVSVTNITGNVSFTTSTLDNNSFHGADISNAGSLTINNSTMSTNSAAGLSANNIGGAVSITNANFNGNSSGIGIDTAVSVTLNTVTANDNTSSLGLFANNITSAGTAVDIDTGQFNGNSSDGLRIANVEGQVTLNLVEASGNGEQGFDVDGADILELRNLILLGNTSGVGGQVDEVDQVRYTSTDLASTADLIVVTGTSITLTRDGDLQQPITYDSDTSRLSIDGDAGNDTIQLNGAFTLGVGDGLTVFGGDDDDLIQSNGVSGFGASVPLILHGEAGNDTLSVSTGSGLGDIVEVDGEFVSVRRGPNAQAATAEVHEWETFEIFDILTGGGDDTIVVNEPAIGTFPNIVNLFGQDENDGAEINLGRSTTDTIFNFDGGDGTNGLTVFTRSVNDNTVDILGPGLMVIAPRAIPGDPTVKTINFVNTRGMNVLSDSGNDTFTVQSMNLAPGFERFSFFGQGDSDIANFQATHGSQSLLAQFDGGAGDDNRLVFFGGAGSNHHLAIDSEQLVARLGTNQPEGPAKQIDYANVQLLQALMSSGQDTFVISQEAAAPALPALISLLASSFNDQLIVNPANIPNSVGIEADMGNGDDSVTVNLTSAPFETTLFIRGGANSDLVQVNADAGGSNVAIGTLASSDRIRISDSDVELLFMNGGAGADVFTNNTSVNSILDGIGGNDTLTGGAGRDVVFGEGGLDELLGLAEDDLLVSGPLTFDQHQVSLQAIMAEWASGRTFEERIANLSGTGIGPRNNGDVFLIPGVTVFDEGALDLLTGGTEEDWFLAQTAVNDQVLDQQALEDELTQIP